MTSFMFWNLFEVAHDVRAGEESRWRQQVEVVRRYRPDVLAITEGWDWHLDDGALFGRAVKEFGYTDGVLYEAKTRCDTAVMWGDGVGAVDVRRQPLTEAWWHGFLRVTLQLPGEPGPLVVVVSHFNPFDPTLRRIEASWLRKTLDQVDRGVLVMDANCVPPGDPAAPFQLGRNLPGDPIDDRLPLECLAASGLVDIGAALGDRTPTFGYYRAAPDQTQHEGNLVRLDQAWATRGVTASAYRVIDDPETDTASDHRPITFTLE